MVQGKSGLCGFTSTNLPFILQHNGIKNVALAGFLVRYIYRSNWVTFVEAASRILLLSAAKYCYCLRPGGPVCRFWKAVDYKWRGQEGARGAT